MTSGDGARTNVESQCTSGDNEPPTCAAEMERRYISILLAQRDGNRRIVANITGINERTLDRKLNRYELQEQNA